MNEVIYEQSIKNLNIDSIQKWYSTREYLPYDVFKIERSDEGMKGDYCGRFLCIVERPITQEDKESIMFPNDIRNLENIIKKSIELCYWNNLAKRFQDKNNNWVDVLYWTQIPKFPEHECETISIEEMELKIQFGELIEVSHEVGEDRFMCCSVDLFHISFNEKLFFSTFINKNGEREYKYCIKK